MLTHAQHLATQLAHDLPEIQWIDRDKGQLDNPEAFHSLLVPALLLDMGEVSWEGVSRGSQRGLLTLTVKLVFRLPPATHRDLPLAEFSEMADLTTKVHQALGRGLMVKDRRTSRDYFTPEFYVMEQTYDMFVTYTTPDRTMPRPNPDIQASLKLPLAVNP